MVVNDNDNRLVSNYSNSDWEEYVKGPLTVYMQEHGIEKIGVNDGCGKKATVSRTKDGGFKVNITYNEEL